MSQLHPIYLVWKTGGEDIDLGIGYHSVIPPKGSLLTFVCDHGTVWRVVEQYFHMVMHGSMNWRNWHAGRGTEGGMVYLFVEPAEGPYEPAPGGEDGKT